jgi:TPR repeat protein
MVSVAYVVSAYERGDYETAYKEFKTFAEQGSPHAQSCLGVMYVKGQGVPQDDAEALKWFHRAANQGVATAQYNLGLMYANGQGVAQGYAEAMTWYRKAAEQGKSPAIMRLQQTSTISVIGSLSAGEMTRSRQSCFLATLPLPFDQRRYVWVRIDRDRIIDW